MTGGADLIELFLVPGPIGNLGDMSTRALEVLRAVDLIICEDTRRTGLLLAHWSIRRPLTAFFHPREQQQLPAILARLESGQKAALLSDAGTPGISDPGYLLVREVLARGGVVHPLPGPTAFTTALVASGLPTNRFVFLGFPPRKPGEIEAFLQPWQRSEMTLILYENPARLERWLPLALEVLGDRPLVLAFELSKMFERFHRSRLSLWVAGERPESMKGELVLLLGGYEGVAKEEGEERPVPRTREELMKLVMEQWGWSRAQVRQALMNKEPH